MLSESLWVLCEWFVSTLWVVLCEECFVNVFCESFVNACESCVNALGVFLRLLCDCFVNSLWTRCECFVSTLWMLCEWFVNALWILCACVVSTLWMLCECLWTPCECFEQVFVKPFPFPPTSYHPEGGSSVYMAIYHVFRHHKTQKDRLHTKFEKWA